ncbi:hypothetical protein TSUD_349530 [Trifolium subterraneum]|uniref:Uncharacterized protein n=1 Tax=Trifolium subterraneum TaxID=3900 RepID=A0A2Z6NJC9_TRISU|nr:hypothetical protein TSUD_349530 [Trifolium subterraneum]
MQEIESIESDYYIGEDIAKKIFFAFYTPTACKHTEWTQFPKFLLLMTKECMIGPGDKDHRRRRMASWPHNNLEGHGLKEIGQTYFGQTYTVSRQEGGGLEEDVELQHMTTIIINNPTISN